MLKLYLKNVFWFIIHVLSAITKLVHFSLFSSFCFLGLSTCFWVFCFQVRQETVKVLLSGLLSLLESKKDMKVIEKNNKKKTTPSISYMCTCICYLKHHRKTVILITEPHLFLHFLCFLSFSVSLEGQLQSLYRDWRTLYKDTFLEKN